MSVIRNMFAHVTRLSMAAKTRQERYSIRDGDWNLNHKLAFLVAFCCVQ